MLLWLWGLIVGSRCEHDWEPLAKVKTYDDPNDESTQVGTRYVYRCKKCCAFRKVNI